MLNRKGANVKSTGPQLREIVQAAIDQARAESDRLRALPAGFDAYLAYAGQLTAALHRSFKKPGRSRGHPEPGEGSSQPPAPAYIEYPMRVRRIIQTWFERGLSGRILWLICDAITRSRFAPRQK